MIGGQIIDIYGSDSNGCGRNGILPGVFNLLNGGHELSGELIPEEGLFGCQFQKTLIAGMCSFRTRGVESHGLEKSSD